MSRSKKIKIENITVTKPSLPDLDEFIPYLKEIWNNKWLTNNGPFHQQLEKKLEEFLGVEHVCLCSNGTLALMLALKALNIKGEVITTPFSFVATSHAIAWSGCKPIFSDIEENSFNLDPEHIENKITPKTTAIMPVHVYGNPCDNEKLSLIAEKYGLKLIYDAAHAFHFNKDGMSILNWGDLSVLSFHATKVFNTFEGGAIICHSEEMKQRINDLKNFGFHDEVTVSDIGINAKMNEVQAAMGLVQLKSIDKLIDKRKSIAKFYSDRLTKISGIKIFDVDATIKSNYAYYPILIDDKGYGMTRDELYSELINHQIFSRRYFYPLISDMPMYKDLESSNPEDLPIAKKISEQVLCLPIYPDLKNVEVEKIISIIERYHRS